MRPIYNPAGEGYVGYIENKLCVYKILNDKTEGIMPSCRVVWVEETLNDNIEHDIPQISSVTVTKEESAFSNTCQFSIENVAPTNPTDYGYFTPHRNDEEHNKPINSWHAILVPQVMIRVYMGYVTQIFVDDEPVDWIDEVTVWTGRIDAVTIDNQPNGCTMTIRARDFAALLLDQNVNQTYGSPAVKYWTIEYPLTATTVTTDYYLNTGSTDWANPELSSVVKDIISRAMGCTQVFTYIESTGIYINSTDLSFETFTNTKWADIIERIKGITHFDFWCDEDGLFHFSKPQQTSITTTNVSRTATMTDDMFDILYFSTKYATSDSLVVKNETLDITYNTGGNLDYTYNENGGMIFEIKPEESGRIAENDILKISFNHVNWIFKNGVNIYSLPFTLSHDNVFASILVCNTIDSPSCSYQQDVTNHTLWDSSIIMPDKILIIEEPSFVTNAQCQTLAEKICSDMKERYMQVEFECTPLPHLQTGDIIQIIVYGCITEAYRIDGQTLSYFANGSMTQSLKCHHYAYVPH